MADNDRGHASNDPQKASESGRKGGQSQGQDNNPGNFANDPQKASEAGKKGGQSRSGQNESDVMEEDALNID